MTSDEKNRIEEISKVSLYSSGINKSTIEYSFSILNRHLRGENILEMGPAEGVMTELLVKTGKALTLVEGSSLFCDDLSKRYPEAKVVNALFEEFEPEEKFDTIVLGHVLEHVEDPVDIVSRAGKWLKPEGKIFAAVPNARSVHRQAAVIMGLLPQEDALNDLDIHHGHRRVYNPESLRSDFTKSGLKVDIYGGYWLKPISNRQLEEDWTEEMIDAFMMLGERYPDIAGEIYVLASLPADK